MLSNLLVSLGMLASVASACKRQITPPPNVILILTDDQDIHMNSMDYMPFLKEHITDQGTWYRRHYCTVAICCPSRVNLLTGKLSHNTNVTDVVVPYGGYPKFMSEGLNENYLPIWVQEAGYSTYYAGKLLNAHTVDNYNQPHAAGWTSSDFLLDPYTYNYLNGTWQRDTDAPMSYEGQYSQDILTNKSLAYLEDANSLAKPFFLGIAPVAPHSEALIAQSVFNLSDPGGEDIDAVQLQILAPQPAARHRDLFAGLQIPRTPDFNPDVPTGVTWVAELPQLNQTSLDYNDNFFRQRLRALQSVDEMIDDIVKKLEELGILDNTYIIYTTDNGYHIGQHRMQPGKQCGFETDINIPFLIRGPGVPKGVISDVVTSHTDVAPTILEMMGLPLRSDFDGAPIPLTQESMDQAMTERREHVGIEFWGFAINEAWASSIGTGNTYKGMRIHGQTVNIYYAVHCNNEHELYDLNVDQYQMNNLLPSINGTGLPLSTYANSTVTISGYALPQLINRLDALLMVAKSCKGTTCTNPWSVIHPQGDVTSIDDAMDSRFDYFYSLAARDNPVGYTSCANGYLISEEGPQDPPVFGA